MEIEFKYVFSFFFFFQDGFTAHFSESSQSQTMWKSLFTVGSICAAGLTLLALNKWKYYQLFCTLGFFTLSLYLHWDQDYSLTTCKMVVTPCWLNMSKLTSHSITFCVIEYALYVFTSSLLHFKSGNNSIIWIQGIDVYCVKRKNWVKLLMFV